MAETEADVLEMRPREDMATCRLSIKGASVGTQRRLVDSEVSYAQVLGVSVNIGTNPVDVPGGLNAFSGPSSGPASSWESAVRWSLRKESQAKGRRRAVSQVFKLGVVRQMASSVMRVQPAAEFMREVAEELVLR